MSPTDEEGRNYIFSPPFHDFSFEGELGLGVWHDGTSEVSIQCVVGEKPFDFYIYRIDGTEKTILLKARFIEMKKENIAKFEIYSGYTTNDIIPNSKTFTIFKQPATP